MNPLRRNLLEKMGEGGCIYQALGLYLATFCLYLQVVGLWVVLCFKILAFYIFVAKCFINLFADGAVSIYIGTFSFCASF